MTSLEKIPCSVEILTRNSEAGLARCLESVKDFAEIIVVDGNSTDKTREIAGRYGCKIISQYDTDEQEVRIKDFSEVRNKGIRASTHAWFMFIDSDEYLSSDAVEEIRGIVTSSHPKAYAWWQPRLYVLNGKVIRCATTYPNKQMRLFHKSHIRGFIKPIHERIALLPETPVGTLTGVEYVPVTPLEESHAKWKRYMQSELEACRIAPRWTLFRVAFRQFLLFGLYTGRYMRNLFLCGNSRMPLRYEWARHRYLLIAIPELLKLSLRSRR